MPSDRQKWRNQAQNDVNFSDGLSDSLLRPPSEKEGKIMREIGFLAASDAPDGLFRISPIDFQELGVRFC